MAVRVERVGLCTEVSGVLQETGEADPATAVRTKARAVIREFLATFGGIPPIDLEAVASFRGLRLSSDAPRHSPDAEIAPEPDGGVALRINRERPQTRQRFSIGHEIGHTLFPGYGLAVRCRKAIDRRWADPDDLVESLCDVASSEFLFPAPWFPDRASGMVVSAAGLIEMAADYEASRDATVRRFVEIRPEPMAAVFFSWKLKPSERRTSRGRRPAEPKLRVDYAVANDGFGRACGFVPKDKSVPPEGPIFEAATLHMPWDGEMLLDFGAFRDRFSIHALPVYTPDDAAGPDGASSVVAVLTPF